MPKLFSLFIIAVSLLCAACGIYRQEIRQGNIIEPAMRAALKPGLSKDEVRRICGTPLIQDAFHKDRWDYVYYHKENNQSPKRNRMTLIFQNGKLVNIIES